jgi:hypothetical protein
VRRYPTNTILGLITPLAFELNAWWELQKIVILMTAASVRPLHALTLT